MNLVSPDVSVFGHFLHDVLPYLLCCKAGVFSDCGKYYSKRPSDRGIDFSPPPPPRKNKYCVHNILTKHIISFELYMYSGYVGRSSYFDS